jgi:hypothetical protein
MIFKFNKVYILESLKDNELKTGKLLYEDMFHHNNETNEYGFEYQPIKNLKALKRFFEIILLEIKTKEISPIIHLEMHGSISGITLSSDEIIEWNDFAILIQEINIELKNKLVVVLALCHGIHFLSAFYNLIESRSPFAGLIACGDISKVEEIKNGFPRFYKYLLSSNNGNIALKELNKIINDEGRLYSLLTCRYLFKQAFIEYLKLCSANQVTKRTERIISKIKITNPKIDITKVRKDLKTHLHKNNQKNIFMNIRDIFLMYDLDPSNKELFRIEYSDISQEI